jgi:putative membrane protein
MRFLVRLAAGALALWIATVLVDGIEVTTQSTTQQVATLLVVAFIFGVLNAVVRPLLNLLSLPLILLTLGLFLFVVNAAMLLLLSWISGLVGLAFTVESFWDALLGAVIISIASFLIDVVLPERYES